MNANPKKAKLFILVSICLVALLFIIVVAQIATINAKNSELASQEETISTLNDQLAYYQSNTDNKSGDYEIEIQENLE